MLFQRILFVGQILYLRMSFKARQKLWKPPRLMWLLAIKMWIWELGKKAYLGCFYTSFQMLTNRYIHLIVLKKSFLSIWKLVDLILKTYTIFQPYEWSFFKKSVKVNWFKPSCSKMYRLTHLKIQLWSTRSNIDWFI